MVNLPSCLFFCNLDMIALIPFFLGLMSSIDLGLSSLTSSQFDLLSSSTKESSFETFSLL